ncbi:MAG: ABC transporter substrate-binding protein [Thermodesulfobacteriota bacterium]|nr:ABC transporter substrate-binding protein [Thermodesulfobacteriota bacterium]
MSKRKSLFSIVLLSLMISQLAWLGGCDQKKEPIKIGLSINLSGRGGTAGEYIRDGAMLAVSEINQKGGIHGRPISLLIKDDKNTEEGIIQADEELIAEGVPVIIGHTYSETTLKAYPYVTSRNTILFTAFTATTRLTAKDDLFFRTSVDNSAYGRALNTLLTKRQIQTVSFLLDMSNSSFVLDYVEQTRKYYSGHVAVVQFNSREKTDWDSIIPDLMDAKPDAIMLLTEVTMTGVAAQKLRAKGFEGDFIASLWAQTPDLMRYGGRDVEDLTIITFISPQYQNPQYVDFAKGIKEKFNKSVTARTVRAYEAVHIISQALKQCEEMSAPELKKALLNISKFDSVMGPLRFDAFGDVIRPVFEIRIKNGKFHNEGQIK